jgi:hypothetical protein
MTIWVEEHGFDSFSASFYGKEIVWKEGDKEQKGAIFFVTSHGAVLLRTAAGESKMLEYGPQFYLVDSS